MVLFMANEIEKREDGLPEEYVYKTHTKVIKADDSKLEIPYQDILNKVLYFIDVSEIVNNVQKESEYVVQIPKEFQKQFNSGKYWINKNQKTGIEWPTLMRRGEDGRNKIVTNLSIKEESFIQGNPIQDLTNQFQMIQIQSSLQEQSERLESICKTVEHIKKGQMNDRIGLLNSGREQIYYALQRDDSDPKKRDVIEKGISDMITAQNQIFEELQLECEGFHSIPQSKIFQFIEEIKHPDYYEEKSNEYNHILDLYKLYKESTKYIAAAYLLIGQPQVVESIYSKSTDKLETINYSKLRSILYLENGLTIFTEYDQEELLEDKTECLELCEEYDLSIEVSGQELLKVIDYGTQTGENGSEETSD